MTPIQDNPESLLEFPCEISIKAMGRNSEQFPAMVLALIEKHCAEVNQDAVSVRASRGNRYLSVTVTVTACNRAQLDRIYADLSAHPEVLVAL